MDNLDWIVKGESLLGVVSAWRKWAQLPTYFPVDQEVDHWLTQSQVSQVIILLIDGMGSRILQHHLSDEDLLNQACYKEVNTVVPSTTAAATTSVVTGKSPSQTGWIGWHQYFSELQDSIILFYGQGYYSNKPVPHYAYQTIPYLDQVDQLQQMGIPATSCYPAFRPHGATSFNQLCNQLAQESQSQRCRLVYAYWDELDTLMHQVGPHHNQVKNLLESFNQQVSLLVQRLSKKTGLIVIADHGMKEVREENLTDYPELMDCLSYFPTVESRAVSFRIKSQRENEFVSLFKQRYQNLFLLFTKQELLQSKILGKGKPHPRLNDFIGDYFALAISDVSLVYHLKPQRTMRGQHAGLCEEEMKVPVLLIQGQQET